MSYGFDNIAGVLKITPSLLERYMAAARQISRVAVGSSPLPPTAETFRLAADLVAGRAASTSCRSARAAAPPSATASRSTANTSSRSSRSAAGASEGPHQLEVGIDGERVKLFTLGAARAAARGQGYDSEG